mmetsp:Transcript_23485/g.61083  ORF Transcript_23485/g.61083 Transcript_23485/m.61083 type:complete len:212 (-) Transcript_23485:861-1496(-)
MELAKGGATALPTIWKSSLLRSLTSLHAFISKPTAGSRLCSSPTMVLPGGSPTSSLACTSRASARSAKLCCRCFCCCCCSMGDGCCLPWLCCPSSSRFKLCCCLWCCCFCWCFGSGSSRLTAGVRGRSSAWCLPVCCCCCRCCCCCWPCNSCSCCGWGSQFLKQAILSPTSCTAFCSIVSKSKACRVKLQPDTSLLVGRVSKSSPTLASVK